MLLGSELSKKHSVLIVEKLKTNPTNKYWLTNLEVINKNGIFEFSDCIDSEYKHLDFIAFNGYKYRCFGDYILWDTAKLTSHLQNKISENRGDFLFSHRFYSYHYSKNRINVRVNEKIVSARLLVDCMGYESPIAAANDMIDVTGYYILYGSKLRLKKRIDPICLSNTILNKRAKYLEILPTKSDFAYTVMLYPTRSTTINSQIRNDFSFLTERSEFSHYFEHEENTKNKIGGIVPVGKLKSNSLDRLFLYGESAQMNPSATGTCFTKLLDNYKSIAEYLSKKINADRLEKKDLALPSRNLGKIYNQKFQLNLYEEVLNWSSNDFLRVLNLLDESHNKLLNEILFEDLHLKTVIKSLDLHKSLRGRYYFLKLYIKSIFQEI